MPAMFGGPLRRTRLRPYAGDLALTLFDNARALCPSEADKLKRTLIGNAMLRKNEASDYQSETFQLQIKGRSIACKIRNSRYHAAIILRLPIEGAPDRWGMLVSERYQHLAGEHEDERTRRIIINYDEELEHKGIANRDYGGEEAHRPGVQMLVSIPGTLTDLVMDGLIGAPLAQIATMPEPFGQGLAGQKIVETISASIPPMGPRTIFIAR